MLKLASFELPLVPVKESEELGHEAAESELEPLLQLRLTDSQMDADEKPR